MSPPPIYRRGAVLVPAARHTMAPPADVPDVLGEAKAEMKIGGDEDVVIGDKGAWRGRCGDDAAVLGNAGGSDPAVLRDADGFDPAVLRDAGVQRGKVIGEVVDCF
ncbi:hypothetical protein ACLOJK_026784 [Asimina triloba]